MILVKYLCQTFSHALYYDIRIAIYNTRLKHVKEYLCKLQSLFSLFYISVSFLKVHEYRVSDCYFNLLINLIMRHQHMFDCYTGLFQDDASTCS